MSAPPALIAAVERLRPDDPREVADRRRILDLAEHVPDPFARDHFVPGHLTASAIVLHPRSARVIVVAHPKLQRWLQPGGHAEPGESDPHAIASREAREETGLEIVPAIPDAILDVDVHEIPAHGREPAHQHFDLRVLFVATGGSTARTSELASRWVTLAELDALGADRGLLRAAAKGLALRR